MLTIAEWNDWSAAYLETFGIAHENGLAMIARWFEQAEAMGATPDDLNAVMRMIRASPPTRFDMHPAAFFGALRSAIGSRRAATPRPSDNGKAPPGAISDLIAAMRARDPAWQRRHAARQAKAKREAEASPTLNNGGIEQLRRMMADDARRRKPTEAKP